MQCHCNNKGNDYDLTPSVLAAGQELSQGLCVYDCSVFITAQLHRCCYALLFPKEGTKAQRGSATSKHCTALEQCSWYVPRACLVETHSQHCAHCPSAGSCTKVWRGEPPPEKMGIQPEALPGTLMAQLWCCSHLESKPANGRSYCLSIILTFK